MILRAGAVVIIALAVGGSSRAQIKVDIDVSQFLQKVENSSARTLLTTP